MTALLLVVAWPSDPPPGAPLLVSATSPDGRYRVEGRAVLGRDESRLLLHVHDLRPGGGLAVFSGRFVNGSFRPGWDCGADGCRGFWWSARDQDRIALPPGWRARWRGWLSR